MAGLSRRGIVKTYPDGTEALRGIDLDVEEGELLVLLGPSGCGKTTLLRIVAGLEAPSAGAVNIADRDVTRLSPKERNVAMVFQNYALYPHMTVFQNLSFGLEVRGVPKEERKRRVVRVARMLGVESLLPKKPSALSGGQRQRVALGRAIVREPNVFLMDEPLSNLDSVLRARMRMELVALHRRLGRTTVYVTHDQTEAMSMGDRVAVMKEGRILQIGTPREVYDRPSHTFVAQFLGSPPMNLWTATVSNGRLRVLPEGPTLTPPDLLSGELQEGRTLTVGARPEDLEIVGEDSEEAIRGRVAFAEFAGGELLLRVESPCGELLVTSKADGAPRPGQEARVRVRRGSLHLFDAESGLRIS